MNNTSPKTTRKNYQALWFAIYAGILFQGFTVLLQHYSQQDRLWFGYFFLLGIPSALISLVIERGTGHRNLTIKIVVIIILLAMVTLTNIGVRSNRQFLIL